MNCWRILGIAPTSELKKIRTAYSEKSKTVHPEEHPEEFRQLHEAYLEAVRIAKRATPQPSFTQQVRPEPAPAPETSEAFVKGSIPPTEAPVLPGGPAPVPQPEPAAETAEAPGERETPPRKPARVPPPLKPSAPPSAERTTDLSENIDFEEIFRRQDRARMQFLNETWNIIYEALEHHRVVKPFAKKAKWETILGMPAFYENGRNMYIMLKLNDYIKAHDDVPPDFCERLRLYYDAGVKNGLMPPQLVRPILDTLGERTAIRKPEYPEKTSGWKKAVMNIKWHIRDNLYYDRNTVSLWALLFLFFHIWVNVITLGRAPGASRFLFDISFALGSIGFIGFVTVIGVNLFLSIRQYSINKRPRSVGVKLRSSFSALLALVMVFLLFNIMMFTH